MLPRDTSGTDFSLCGFSLGFGKENLKSSEMSAERIEEKKETPKETAHRLKSVLLVGRHHLVMNVGSVGAGRAGWLRNMGRPTTILVLACFFFAATPARATTYFVAAAGSDANTGLDTAHPWQTIGKVNGFTFVAGDSISFNRGDVWYGTSLTAPSSGSSGSPITFGAYGSGANPIIKGSTLLVTSGYVLAPDTPTTIFSLSDSATSSTDSATRNWREQVSHLDITANATKIRITVTASATEQSSR